MPILSDRSVSLKPALSIGLENRISGDAPSQADIAFKFARILDNERKQNASRDFGVALWISRNKYMVVHRRSKPGDGRKIGGVAFSPWRREIVITPAATIRGLGETFLSLIHQQRLTDDQINDVEGDRYNKLELEFGGNHLQRYEFVFIEAQMFSPKSSIGAWFEERFRLNITPWATPEDIGTALIDAIAYYAPNQERWINPKPAARRSLVD